MVAFLYAQEQCLTVMYIGSPCFSLGASYSKTGFLLKMNKYKILIFTKARFFLLCLIAVKCFVVHVLFAENNIMYFCQKLASKSATQNNRFMLCTARRKKKFKNIYFWNRTKQIVYTGSSADLVVKEKERVNLTCEARGYPEPQVLSFGIFFIENVTISTKFCVRSSKYYRKIWFYLYNPTR